VNTVVIPDDVVGAYARSPETDRLKPLAAVEIHASRPPDEAALIDRMRRADVVLSFRPAFTKFPGPVIRAAERLGMLCISGTGVEDVDVAAATGRGIAVTNVVGSANRAVAEHCLALMFAVSRQVSAQDRAIRSGVWQAQEGIELGGRTLGIVGLSAIARELTPMAAALGMRLLSWSRNNDPGRAAQAGATAVSLETLLAESDVVSVHLRLNAETRDFVSARQLAAMKPGAIVVNTARGQVIDETALIAALRSGHLRGAGLDVFAEEPLPAGHPFLEMPNVVMTPVAAWNTVESSERMIRWSIDNVVGFLTGRPINVVNQEALACRPPAAPAGGRA